MNLAMLPLQTLHVLHQGVSDELRIREKHVVSVISKVKMNNEHIFLKKAQDLKEKEEIEARTMKLEPRSSNYRSM